MATIKLKSLRPGMVNAEDVKDINGRIILPKNQKLTDKHLKIFKKWGVNRVIVKDKREKEVTKDKRISPNQFSFPSEIPQDLILKAEKACSELFRFNNIEHPVINECYRISIGYKIKNMPGGEGLDVV